MIARDLLRRLALLVPAVLCGCNAATTCTSGTSCQGSCVSLLSDNLNCGACGHICVPGQACSNGSCLTSCTQGYAVCASDAGEYCADLSVDFNNCGTCGQSCVSGAYCSGGQCRTVGTFCPTGQMSCGDAGQSVCVDLANDPENCGVCGKVCLLTETCMAGACQAACPPGYPLCPLADAGLACTDLSLDVDNCGHCGNSCGPAAVCVGGACACQSGFTACGSSASCVDTSADRNNCGSCRAMCVACESCTAAVCAVAPFLARGAELYGDGGATGLSAAVADFDGDGLPDIAVIEQTSLGGSYVEIYLGDGGGGFPRTLLYASDDGEEGAALAPIDLYGDGRKELAVATLNDDFGGSGFMVLAVDAGALVRLLYQSSDTNATGFPYYLQQAGGLVVGDLNNDGRDDVVVLNQDAGPDLFTSQGDGTFAHGSPFPGSFCRNPRGLWLATAIGDLDGDGKNDLAVSCRDFTVSGWLQSADGQFVALPTFMLGNASVLQNFPYRLVVAGKRLDILTYTGFSGYGWSDAGFDLIGTYAGEGGSGIACGDFNGDGVPDVVVGGPQVFLGRAGGFGQASASEGLGTVLAVGDLDGDGRVDVVVAGGLFPGSVVSVLLNTCSP